MQREVAEVTAWEIDIVRLFRLLSLRLAGRLAEVRAPLEEYLRDARHRGDRFVETSLAAGINMAWLATDEPIEAQAALESSAWQPLPGSYHTQHFFALLARAELAMYRGEPGSLDRLAADFATLGRSFLASVENVKTEVAYLRGRLALFDSNAGTPRLAEADRAARRLASTQLEYAAAWARAITSGAAAARGDLDTARAHLIELVELADGDGDQPLLAACARLRLATLVGGTTAAELSAAAATAFADLGVSNPARMAAVWLPWPAG
jgi:hypothetical protein